MSILTLFTRRGGAKPTEGIEADLAYRDNQMVEIIRPLTLDEADAEVGPMFKVRFSDGFTADVFEDELNRTT